MLFISFTSLLFELKSQAATSLNGILFGTTPPIPNALATKTLNF